MKAVAYVQKIVPTEIEVPDKLVQTIWTEDEENNYFTKEYGIAVDTLVRFIRENYGIDYDDDYTCLMGERNGEDFPILEY